MQSLTRLDLFEPYPKRNEKIHVPPPKPPSPYHHHLPPPPSHLASTQPSSPRSPSHPNPNPNLQLRPCPPLLLSSPLLLFIPSVLSSSNNNPLHNQLSSTFLHPAPNLCLLVLSLLTFLLYQYLYDSTFPPSYLIFPDCEAVLATYSSKIKLHANKFLLVILSYLSLTSLYHHLTACVNPTPTTTSHPYTIPRNPSPSA